MALPTPRISLPFNGDFLDKSGNGNNVTPSGIILKSDTPKIGSGYAFGDGLNDYGEIADSPSLDAINITVAAWVRYTGTATRVFFERSNGTFGNDDWTCFTTNGRIQTIMVIGGVTKSIVSPLTYNDGNWHLVICMYNGQAVRLFIDNVHVNALIAVGPLGNTSDPITLFARKGPLFPLSGSMDSFLMYGEGLSYGLVGIGQQATGQISEIWNVGAGIEIGEDGVVVILRRGLGRGLNTGLGGGL